MLTTFVHEELGPYGKMVAHFQGLIDRQIEFAKKVLNSRTTCVLIGSMGWKKDIVGHGLATSGRGYAEKGELKSRCSQE